MAGGSFSRDMSQGAIERRARDERDDREQRQMQEEAESKEEEGSEAQEDESPRGQKKRSLSDQIKASLPPHVPSALGVISYNEFKDRYKDVYESVNDQEHLIRGGVVYDTKVAGAPAVVRTLRNSELRAIQPFSPKNEEDIKAHMQWRLYRLVFALEQYGDYTFTTPKTMDPDLFSEWIATDEARQLVQIIDAFPVEVVDSLARICEDVSNAFAFALRELMGNQ